MQAEIGFVQFHPSYDYTDFVEGLRPKNDSNGQIGFERKDGVFKTFCERALISYSINTSNPAIDFFLNPAIDSFLNTEIDSFLNTAKTKNITFDTKFDQDSYNTYKNNYEFNILEINGNEVNIKATGKNHDEHFDNSINKDYLKKLIVSNKPIKAKEDIKGLFPDINEHSEIYYYTLYLNLLERKNRRYVFIIDEINRGDMSKIFGELFFAIGPSYRGAEKCRDLRTQYANLQETPNLFDITLGKKEDFGHFFIPENVYIIGTMNDIDRSVESMDFAFRRRFTFKEITAEDRIEMLDELDDKIRQEAILRMQALNKAIWDDESKTGITGLSSAYHIGGAYFLKLKELNGDFGLLWEYHLAPLLHEYLCGMENEDKKFEALKNAYNLTQSTGEEE